MDAAAQQPSSETATLIVEARDLDTDERSSKTLVVPRPTSTSEQRNQLELAATTIHPTARMRSFADGAATLLARQHLIVAFYADPHPESRSASVDESAQEPLFA